MTDINTASMQEQLARRDHRIAVLEAICAAQKDRLARLAARDGGTKFNFTVYQEGASWIAACLDHDVCATGPTVVSAIERLAVGIGAEDCVAKQQGLSGWTAIKAAPAGTYAPKECNFEAPVAVTLEVVGNPHSLALSRAIASDKPLDAYGRR